MYQKYFYNHSKVSELGRLDKCHDSVHESVTDTSSMESDLDEGSILGTFVCERCDDQPLLDSKSYLKIWHTQAMLE